MKLYFVIIMIIVFFSLFVFFNLFGASFLYEKKNCHNPLSLCKIERNDFDYNEDAVKKLLSIENQCLVKDIKLCKDFLLKVLKEDEYNFCFESDLFLKLIKLSKSNFNKNEFEICFNFKDNQEVFKDKSFYVDVFYNIYLNLNKKMFDDIILYKSGIDELFSSYRDIGVEALSIMNQLSLFSHLILTINHFFKNKFDNRYVKSTLLDFLSFKVLKLFEKRMGMLLKNNSIFFHEAFLLYLNLLNEIVCRNAIDMNFVFINNGLLIPKFVIFYLQNENLYNELINVFNQMRCIYKEAFEIDIFEEFIILNGCAYGENCCITNLKNILKCFMAEKIEKLSEIFLYTLNNLKKRQFFNKLKQYSFCGCPLSIVNMFLGERKEKRYSKNTPLLGVDYKELVELYSQIVSLNVKNSDDKDSTKELNNKNVINLFDKADFNGVPEEILKLLGNI